MSEIIMPSQNESLEFLKAEEKRMLMEVTHAIKQGRFKFKMGLLSRELPQMPKDASESEQRRVYGQMIALYKEMMSKLV